MSGISAMRLPQFSCEHEAGLDALRNKTRKAAAIKRLREILPQKARRCQHLALFPQRAGLRMSVAPIRPKAILRPRCERRCCRTPGIRRYCRCLETEPAIALFTRCGERKPPWHALTAISQSA